MSAEWWGADIIPRIRWRLRVSRRSMTEGDEIPDGWGIAYYDPCIDAVVCMPIPFNAVAGAWRAFIWWLKCPPWRLVEWKADNMRRRVDDAFRDGYDHARRGCQAEIAFLRTRNDGLLKLIVEADLTAPRIIQVSKELFDEAMKGHVS